MLPKIFLKDLRLVTLSHIAREELESLRGAIRYLHMHDIDLVHPSFLPFLAYIYRVDRWDASWSLSHQRAVVKDALILFTLKGTIWAVERALGLSMYDSTVTPWHGMVPKGDKGTFRIEVFPSPTHTLFTAVNYQHIVALVESNKQGSQHWNGSITHQVNGAMYTACALIGRHRYIVRGR